MKKILSLVLAAMMIFSVLPAAFAAETAVAAEVSEDQVEAITLLNNLGIYKGYENGDMGADDLVQRYQMSIFATRFASGRTDDKIWVTTENDSGFTDIVDFAGAADYVTGMISYAAQRGIVNGTGDNKFEPTLYVKYKEAITMVVRALGQVYSAASYPWAYIQFANDNGLLDGIDTDIAPDDYVSRGVIAQLLYNALFVELEDEDGKLLPSVAEKNFSIGHTTVMVTASNNVVYEVGDATVLNTGKIRFAEVDKQGEPTGAGYHADFALFGLADAKAADRAVGTLYNVYYKNNFAGILSTESLAVVYQNRGHDNKVVVASSANNNIYQWDLNYETAKDQYVTVDGHKYQVVMDYTNLNRDQGPASNKAGNDEMKVYKDQGGWYVRAREDLKPGLVMSSDGKFIYNLASANVMVPYAYYSDILDVWYTQDATVAGGWKILKDEDLYIDYGTYNKNIFGYDQQSSATAASAYADITVSANERMTVREYTLGTISFTSNTRVNQYGSKQTGIATFKLNRWTGSVGNTVNGKDADGNAYTPANAMIPDTTSYTLYTMNKDDDANGADITTWGKRPVAGSEYYVDEYRWTGLQKAEIPSGSYVLYYVNHETREIEVIDVIDETNDGDDSYLVSGYIRGFDLASDSLTFGANYDVYYFNYNDLKGATIAGKATQSSTYSARNYAYLSGLYNVPVTLVIVDGKVAHIAADDGVDYVIIDSFVSFEEDCIIANAWSTVENGYTQIKIGSYNGWTVGGIDYWYYFFGKYTGNTNAILNIPFETMTLYKVIDVDDNGLYDLADKGSQISGSKSRDVNVIKEGYIENVQSSGSRNKIVANKYIATSESDYWMILDKVNNKVYSLNGVLNPITFRGKTVDDQGVVLCDGAEFYKAKQDFVIIIDNTYEMSNYSFLSGDVAYYKYNAQVNLYNNENYLVANTFNSYNYSLYMTNVLTGKVELVQLGNDKLLTGTNAYNAYDMYTKLVEGAIYKAEDGVITDVTSPSITVPAVAADYYNNVAGYKVDSVGATGIALDPTDTAATIVAKVNAAMVNTLRSGATSTINYYNSAITVIFESGKAFKSFSGSVASQYYTDNSAYYNSNVLALNNAIKAGTTQYKLYYVINEDTETATAWVVNTGVKYAVSGTANVTAGLDKDPANMSLDAAEVNNFSTIIDATKPAVTAKVSLNEVTDVMTVTFDFTNIKIAKDTVKGTTRIGNDFGATSTSAVINDDGTNVTTIVVTLNGVAEYPATAKQVRVAVERVASTSFEIQLVASIPAA